MEDSHHYISCKICVFPYDNMEHSPRIIPCGHTFCQECIKSLLKVNHIQCPMCKKSFENKNDLPINFEILNIINTRNIENFCIIHKNENLNFFCSDDRKLICQLCLLNEHIGHKIVRPSDSEISSSIQLTNNFKELISNAKNQKHLNQNKIKDNFKCIDEKFEFLNKSLIEIKNILKFNILSKSQKIIDNEEKLQQLDNLINQELFEIKIGKKYTLSSHLFSSFDEIETLFKCNTFYNFQQENDENINLLLKNLSSLFEINNQNNYKLDKELLNKDDYFDIENVLEYLLENKLDSIRYDTSKTTKEYNKLINECLVKSNCKNEFVGNIMKSVNRAEFVADSSNPYYDKPMIIGWNTTISAPHMHILTLLNLSKHIDKFKDKNIKAIDIGCGSGYMTLCLAKLLGPYSKVIGLDHIKEIIEFSYKNIHKSHKFYLESGRIKFIMKDGIDGFMEDSPYDLIHVGAAVDEIPSQLLCQLASGGVMWIPVGPKGDNKKIILVLKNQDNSIFKQELMTVSYAEMVSLEEQLNLSEQNQDYSIDDEEEEEEQSDFYY